LAPGGGPDTPASLIGPEALISPRRPTTVDAVDQPTARRVLADARFASSPPSPPKPAPGGALLLHPQRLLHLLRRRRQPNSTLALCRLDNLRANPAASLLVHHDHEDWSRLWWVRVDGRGKVVDDERETALALELLAAKYPRTGARRRRGR